jgi:uncharacterized metal-binding protein
MPNGEVHAQAASSVAWTVSAAATYEVMTGDPFTQVVAAGIILGVWGGYFVDPDLDMPHKHTITEQRIWRYNRALGILWGAYWYPYARLTGHHGRGSHWIIVGTIPRFLLLWWPLLWLTWWLHSHGMVIHDQLYFKSEVFRSTAILFWACVFAGQTTQDGVHIALDVVYHEGKNIGRKLHLR